MTLTCAQTPFKLAAEVLNGAIDLTDRLASGETLSGTPTITVTSATTDLTLASKVVSSTTLTINGNGVAVGKALQFVIGAGTAGIDYEITASCVTSSSQTVVEVVGIRVR